MTIYLKEDQSSTCWQCGARFVRAAEPTQIGAVYARCPNETHNYGVVGNTAPWGEYTRPVEIEDSR